MENKMNNYMSNARMNEMKTLMARYQREDDHANNLMRDVFVAAGAAERMDTDSFLIAAVQAMSLDFYTGDRSGCRRATNFVEHLMLNPFTCTIVQEPGCGKDRYEYHVVNQKAMTALEGMSYDLNAEWGKYLTEIFYVMLDKKPTHEVAKKMAGMMRDLYNKIVKKL